MVRESGTKRRLVDKIRAGGRWATRIAASPLQRSGLPDVLVLLRVPPGRACWLEVKRPGERPTRLQEQTLTELRAAGAAAVCVTSVADGLAAIEKEEQEWLKRASFQ